MRRLNSRLLIWLAAIVVPATMGLYLLHGFQVARKADTLVARAREKRAAGEIDEAVRLLGRYVGLRPDDVAASAELATTLLTRLEALPPTRRDVSRAFAALETAVRGNPDDQQLRLKLAEFCVRLGRHADAQQHLARLTAPRTAADDHAYPTTAVELLRARAAIGTGDLTAAVEILATIVGFDPDSRAFVSPSGPPDSETATALTLLAAIFATRLDDPATADDVMRRLQQVCPNDPQVWITLARWHLERDDLEAATAAAAHSRTLAADDAETALITCEVALAREDLTAAEQTVTQALAAHPHDERMHRAEALLAIRRGRPAEAVAAIRAGLAHQPESSGLQAMLAELLLTQGDHAAARDVIDALSAAEGRDTPRVTLLEGWCLVEERQWLRAKHVLEQLRPQVVSADQLRRQVDLLLARCHGPLGAFDEQLAVCESLLADAPELTAARRTAAAALVALGRPAEALELLEREPGTAAEEPTTLRAKGLLAMGQVEAAVELLTGAAARQPADPQLQAARVEAIFRQQGPIAAREVLATIPATLAKTPPLLATRALLAASLPPDEAAETLATIETAATQLPRDEQWSVLAAVARHQATRGDRTAATRLWEAILAAQPDDLAAAWELYDLAASTGDATATQARQEAIEQIAGTASADGRTARAGVLMLHVAAAMPDRDDIALDEARHLLIEAEAERPRWQRVHLLLAEAERLRGNRVAERERLQQAIASGPRHSAIVRRLIALLVADHRFDEAARLALTATAETIFATELLGRRPEPAAWQAAVGVLESLASSQPLTVSQRVQLADLRDRLGHWSECRADLQSLAAAADAAPSITALLVGKLIDHEELAAARSWLTKLQRTSPGTAGLLVLEARLAAASGDRQAARAAAEKLLPARPVQPADTEAASRVTRLLEELQLVDMADQLHAEIAAKAPAAVVERAEFLARHSRVDEAVDLLGELWVAPPAAVPRQRVLRAAVTAVQTVTPAAAPQAWATVARWLAEAAEDAPDSPPVLMLRAEFETARENVSVAESLYRAVLADGHADKPTQAVAANNLAFQLAAPATADEAAALIDAAIATLGPQPDLLDTRGLVRLAQGNVAAAIIDLEEACLAPSPAKLMHLAKAYSARGNTTRAAATLARARGRMTASPRLPGREESLLEELERDLLPALQRP